MRTKDDTVVAWDRILAPVSHSGEAKYLSLVKTLADLIATGRLPIGAKLPATRELAQRVGIGRNTALRALTALTEQGYLVSRERSGVFVSDIAQGAQKFEIKSDRSIEAETAFWKERLERTSSITRSLPAFETLSGPVIRFKGTGFDIGLFPTNEWRECERAALGVLEIAEWGRDMVDHDDPLLVAQLRTKVLPKYGIWARPEEILVTMGSQEARYLVARSLGAHGIKVGLEEPGLPELAAAFELAGCTTRAIRLDDQGALPTSQLDDCDIVAIGPGHQYPTTAVMPMERRMQILERAQRKDFIVLEDAIETELLSEEWRLPALKSRDVDGRVVFIGTLSRHVAPGLRVGYLVASAPVVSELRRLRRLIHRHSPGNNQRALAIFIERGHYDGFLRRASRELERRAHILLEISSAGSTGVRWHHKAGTASFWCQLPPKVDGDVIAQTLRTNGVVVERGSGFFRSSRPPHGYLRLTTSSVSDDQIKQGIGLLMDALRQ